MWTDYRRNVFATFERHDQRLSGFKLTDVWSALNRLEREGFIQGDRLGDDAGFQLTAAGRVMARALVTPVQVHSTSSAPPGYL